MHKTDAPPFSSPARPSVCAMSRLDITLFATDLLFCVLCPTSSRRGTDGYELDKTFFQKLLGNPDREVEWPEITSIIICRNCFPKWSNNCVPWPDWDLGIIKSGLLRLTSSQAGQLTTPHCCCPAWQAVKAVAQQSARSILWTGYRNSYLKWNDFSINILTWQMSVCVEWVGLETGSAVWRECGQMWRYEYQAAVWNFLAIVLAVLPDQATPPPPPHFLLFHLISWDSKQKGS